MKHLKRSLEEWSLKDDLLAPKMIFIAGPRQLGKTTLVEDFLTRKKCLNFLYNFDNHKVKSAFRKNPLFFESEARLSKTKSSTVWIGLDEIHKRRKWKDILKGYYDSFKNDFRFIVIGSARLDLFRKSGDSLLGRYFLFNLYPLSLMEVEDPIKAHEWVKFADWDNFNHIFIETLLNTTPLPNDTLEHLLCHSGFPEPFIKGNSRFTNLWHREHIEIYLKDEVRDLSRIYDLDKVEDLVYLLPERIGSPLSVNSLREDLEVSFDAVTNWLNTLNKVYLIFSISPWHKRLTRSMRKEKKYYFINWGNCATNESGRFENMIAVMLKKFISAMEEMGQGKFDLHYIRDLSKREIDFLVTRNRRPLFMVETKLSDKNISKFAVQTSELFDIPYFHVVNDRGILEKKSGKIIVVSANHFLSVLV